MTTENIWQVSLAVLSSIGGATAILAAFVYWLGDLWAKRLIQSEKKLLDQEIESFKVKLKKSEFLFQKEFEAASEFIALVRNVGPKHSQPSMDYYDACDEIACNFEMIERELDSFLAKHGAVLTDDALRLISDCYSTAGEHKFEVTSIDIAAEQNKVAAKLFENLKLAEQMNVKQVRNQALI